jgi:hypothetical protein
MRFHLIDGFLAPCLAGWDEFMDMLLELLLLVHDFVLVMLLLVLLMLFSLELLTVSFFNHTRSFSRVNIYRHVSKGGSKTSFSNQNLHLANPHDKLSTFVLYPSL